MEDEQQLASLVLLLSIRFAGNNNDSDPINGDIKKDAGSATTKIRPLKQQCNDVGPSSSSLQLQLALERNNCKLLCFVGRLIHQYAISNTDLSAAGYAYLRLAVRIAFLRYVSLTEIEQSDDTHKNNNNYHARKYEYCLLNYITAALNTRSSHKIDEVDVEMEWVVQSLLVKLTKTKQKYNMKGSESLPQAWTKTIDTLVARKNDGGQPSNTTKTSNEDIMPRNDEDLMVKTLHSILDGDTISSSNVNQDNDWSMQYDISLISCIQSFLHVYSNGVQPVTGKKSHLPRWTQNTLFNMIHWSQQKQVLSVDVFRLILQYLHICTIDGNQSSQQGNLGQFYSSCVAQHSKEGSCSVEEFGTAIRSFLFYGLIVLSNLAPAQNATNTQQMRGDIYSLILVLWQLFGADWMFVSSVLPKSNRFWWFQEGEMKDNEHRLGPAWPLCTLICLAVGEFRLGLGRWVGKEYGQDSTKDCEHLVSDIHSCARIGTEAVRLMTTIAEDEDALTTWTPDAILHIRKSLEDALNSSVQYFNTMMHPEQTTTQIFPKDQDDVGRSCCLVMGTIAAELEVDHLLASPSAGSEKSLGSGEMEERNLSSFGHALQGALLFCHTLGKRQTGLDEFHEPLTYLLPCILSLLNEPLGEEDDNSTAEETLRSLNKDDCLMLTLLNFLVRVSKHWSGKQSSQMGSMVSTVKLCGLIINDFNKMVQKSSTAELALAEVSSILESQ